MEEIITLKLFGWGASSFSCFSERNLTHFFFQISHDNTTADLNGWNGLETKVRKDARAKGTSESLGLFYLSTSTHSESNANQHAQGHGRNLWTMPVHSNPTWLCLLEILTGVSSGFAACCGLSWQPSTRTRQLSTQPFCPQWDGEEKGQKVKLMGWDKCSLIKQQREYYY